MADTPKTIKTYALDGSLRDFPVAFDYLSRQFVAVTLIGEARTNLVSGVDYRFTSANQITTTVAHGATDAFIEIRRLTNTTPRIVDFKDGSVLTATNLNVSQLQAMHIAEEARDMTTLGIGLDQLALAQASVIRFIGPQTNPPTQRTDGTALQVGDRYSRRSDGLEFVWNGSAWVLNDSMSLSSSLANPAVAGRIVGFKSSVLGAVIRDINSKAGETFSVTDLGAIGDGVTDNAGAFSIVASNHAFTVFVPAGTYRVVLTQSNAASILSMLKRIRVDGKVILEFPSGPLNLTSQVVVNSPDAHKIEAIGAATGFTAITSYDSVTGGVYNYSVTCTVSNPSIFAVGDYTVVRASAGTGDYYAHEGFWKVLAVVGSQVTFLNTHQASVFPTNTMTAGTALVIKSRVVFSGCDGFRFEGPQGLGLFDKIGLIGDWVLSSASGTTGAHGLVICAPVVTPGSDSNANYNPMGNCILGPSFGISGFGEQGVAVSGRGHLVGNYVAVSSCRKRGWYAEGGHIRAKLGLASGNGEDGYIADLGGVIQAALCNASGNRLNGFWSFNNSMLAAATCRSTGNGQNGFECRGMGRLAASASRALYNGGSGYNVSYGGTISADGAEGSSNGAAGFIATSSSIMDVPNSASLNNTTYGYRAEYKSVLRATGGTVSGNGTAPYLNRDSTLFEVSGANGVEDFPNYSVGGRYYNTVKDHYWAFAVTSVGDLSFALDTTAQWTFKADGTVHPSVDGGPSMGRAANRINTYFGVNTSISSSDARLKTAVRQLSEQEVMAALAIDDEFGIWQWLSKVESEGGDARMHAGMTVQRAMEIMQSYGLDPFSYGFICYDEWADEFSEIPEEVTHNDDGSVTTIPAKTVLTTKAGSLYSFRMTELHSFILAGRNADLKKVRLELDSAITRIKALEDKLANT